ncbi:MAG: PSD1 and planctomycete cytochrome C domain-containing protein [Gemmataceae bacterium]
MFRRRVGLLLLGAFGVCGFAAGQEPAGAAPPKAEVVKSDTVPTAEGIAFFEKKIRPVLVKECFGCHSTEKGKKVRGGLALDSREGILEGGDTGPVIVPGAPGRSRLIKALSHADPKLTMPPKKKLDAEVVRDFEEWIRMGAPDPRTEAKSAYKYPLEQGRKHWAYQAPKKAAAPKVKSAAWPRTDVDRFILSALEVKGLSPVDDADRRTLLRRVSFDLIGLPPTPAEVEAFVADTSADAFEKVVDHLLASPRFGEKWARHWLDVARYAESTGKTVNFAYPHAWRYRDYVIAAFNSDKPYDQFIKEQLAGDLLPLPSGDPKLKAERLIATGFLAIGPRILNERSGLKFELDAVDEQIDVTTQAFLGITAACARCHDHKFDPIAQKDYYALAGIFRSTETCYGTVRFINAQRPTPLLPLPKEANPGAGTPKQTAAERKRVEDQIKAVRESTKRMKDPIQQFFASGQISLLQAKLDAYDADGNPKLLAMGVRDKPTGGGFGPVKGKFGGFAGFTYDGQHTIGDSPIYIRGEPEQPGEERIPRGALEVITKTPLKPGRSSSGRLELAEWIASKENPLTARVLVNRVWLHLFGRGLVPTANDFGLAGRAPTHPELLDFLAHDFMDNGWSVKKLIRRLVLSHVYQLGSTARAGAMEVDPDNTLLWRMTPRRLEAESLRDALLAVSEQLDTTPPLGSPVARAGEGPVARFGGGDPLGAAMSDLRNTRRSIYLPIVRDKLPEVLALFDVADPTLIAADRPTTTVPAQGLFLLNNAFALRAADQAAEKLLKSGDGEAGRIREAFARFYGRPATAREQAGAEAFLARYRAQLAKDGMAAARRERESWSAFCQALFASAEFQYRK